MKKMMSSLVILLGFAAALFPADQTKRNLPERFKTWLEEEVVYIITPTERSVFLKLQSDRERELFVDAFWKHRDPTPNSPENEFRTEHYRRINYANRYLGRETPKDGWRTHRGRMYIILGEPQEIQRFEGKAGIYNCETWFYQGKADLGLPAGFYLLFYQKGGYGEYQLYSPTSDGPMALLTNYYGDPADYRMAYESLWEIDSTLATVSFSLIPGEESGAFGRPSMASDMMVQRIESSPARSVKERYAQKFLEYKDLVEVEYTANYIDSDALTKIFREPSGVYFVHYSIEPERLSVNVYDDKYYTTFQLNGRITTLDGRLVFQYDKPVSLDMPEAQMKEVSRSPFNIHDLFPLLPGEYRLSLLLKNEVSKEFTSLEQTLRIPQNDAGLQMTQPLLGYRAVRLAPDEQRIKAFRIGPYQVYCQPGRIFTTGDTLVVAFQLNNLSAEQRQGGSVRLAFEKDGQLFREMMRKPEDLSDLPNVIEEISLVDFPPAHYRIRVTFLEGGVEVVTGTEEFDVSFADAVARPWHSSRILPDIDDPVFDQILGSQLFNLNRFSEARVYLERAFQKKPGAVDAAGNLAQVYLALGEAEAAIEILTPFLAETSVGPARYEIYVLAGEALMKTGDFGRAVTVLDRAVSHYGVNAALLNMLGTCYAGQGNTKDALAAFEKSLELSPDQPEISKKIAELKKK